jgi:16S rRNA (guanine(1405)-N(7))-methyltransferase
VTALPPGGDRAAAVAAAVLASKRYRWLAPDLVSRVAAAEAPKSSRNADAVKRTKRRLHQIFGAYVLALDPATALRDLATAAHSGDPARLRDACRRAMAQHASTRERLAVLDTFYRRIFDVTGPPRRLLDVACGLAPLAVPWMSLPMDTAYAACDVDQRIVDVVAGFLAAIDLPHQVELRDALDPGAFPPAGVALLLKSAPCLDQQSRGATRALLERLDAPHLVVSYPTHSLGGAGKGMVDHYRTAFRDTTDGLPGTVTELLFPSELVFVLSR